MLHWLRSKHTFYFILMSIALSLASCKSGRDMIKNENDLISAISKAKGNTIELENKSYHLPSSLIIDKPVRIVGQVNTKLIFSKSDQNGLVVYSNNVMIENVEIIFNASALGIPKNVHFKRGKFKKADFIKKGNRFNSGIYLRDVNDVKIKNCRFIDWLGDGILVWSSKNVQILDNYFFSPYYIQYTADVHVKGKVGETSSDILISGNECSSNTRHGISVGNGGYVQKVIIEKNHVNTDFKSLGDKFLRNHGILAFYGAEHIPQNSEVLIQDNTINGTRNTGIYVPGGYSVEIRNNSLENVGLADGVKISGGILVGNDLESALIENNTIINYRGSFPERAAIGTFGPTKGHNGSINIRNNTIERSTNGIAIDQEFASVKIIGNEIEDIERTSIYVRKNHGVKNKKGTVIIESNIIKENLSGSNPVIDVKGKNIESVIINRNDIKGRLDATCFRIEADDVEISQNQIENFKEVIELKSKGRKARQVKFEENTIKNIEEVFSKNSKIESEQVQSSNKIKKRQQR